MGGRVGPSVSRAGLVLVALAALGCEDRLVLGSTCTYTSDCAETLACAAGRCRAECREDRDCAGVGETCTRFGGGGGVCTPPSSAVPCRLHSDCGPDAQCVDRACRATCDDGADCESGESCEATGLCSAPLLSPPMPIDGGEDACSGGSRLRCPGELVCRNIETDPENCGACDVVCPSGRCHDHHCVPPNDECADAEVIDLSGGFVRVNRDGMGGADDSPGSCGPGPDVFFRFALEHRSLVWALAENETTYAIGVGFHDACGGGATGCVTIFAPELMTRSEAIATLEPGDHWLSVDVDDWTQGFDGWSVRVYAMPVSDGPVTELFFDPAGVLVPATFSGSSLGASSSPASCAPGPDVAYFFRVLPGELGSAVSYEATTCGSGAFDGALSLVRADGGAPLCAGTDECGAHGTLRFVLSPSTDPEGLYAIFVDGTTASDAGDFTLSIAATP